VSPEIKKQPKLRELTFIAAEGLGADDPEFLSGFIGFLKSKGYDPDQLVFSGFDGTAVKKGQPLERKPGIFAMNLAGWETTFTGSEGAVNNPAQYAEDYEGLGAPAIGLFDKNQLAEAYSHESMDVPPNLVGTHSSNDLSFQGAPIKFDQAEPGYESEGNAESYEELMDERIEFKNVEMGEHLAAMPPDRPVTEGVVHINYPDGSPIDALLGVVFLERE
jgi:hypothetical protein